MLKILKRDEMLKALHSFRLVEKIIFYFFFLIMSVSALFMAHKVNNLFTIEVPAPGGEINEGVVGYPRYINPLLPVTDVGRDLSMLLFSGLFRATEEGDVVPDLAQDYTVSEDGLKYEITLKDDIYFHDKTPITAYDVEFTIKKALDPVLKSPKAPNWEGVSIEVNATNKITFTLKKPYALFLENLTLGILPKNIWKDVESEAFAFSQYNFEPIGSGPYKVKKIQRNKSGLPEFYHLTPFSKYNRGKAKVSDLYFRFYTNEEKLVEALNKGEVESAGSLSPESLGNLKKKDNIVSAPLPRIFGVFFNQNENKIFLNKEVRNALNQSVDREEIIEKVLLGFGTTSWGPLPYSIASKSLSGEEKNNIKKAKAILEKAGWVLNKEENVLEKKTKEGTEKLSFSIETGSVPELKNTAYLLKETWEKLGAKVDVKIFELGDLQQNVIRPRKYEALLFGEVIGRELDLYAFWHSSERNDPGLNIALYTNSKTDKLLEQARQTIDREKRIGILKNFETEIIKDVPAVFLFSPNFIYIVPDRLKGLSLSNIITSSDRFNSVNNWYIETERVWKFLKK